MNVIISKRDMRCEMKKRKMKIKNLLMVLLLVAFSLFAAGCDDLEDSDDYEDEYEDEYKDYYSDDNDGGASKGSYSLGTAGELDGKTLIVSIFASDKSCYWDFENEQDIDTYNWVYDDLQIGTDWICDVAKDYNKSCEFIYDVDENEDLYYEADLNIEDVTYAVDNDGDNMDMAAFKYIDKNINVEELKAKYKADNVVFLMLFNTSLDNEVTSCTRNYYEGMPYPYEVCYMFMHYDEELTCPAVFAHEILHTFGALDLYAADDETGITQEYVDYAEEENTNDIMRTTFDVDSDEPHYDKVSNEITDITAYYIGWIKKSDTVNEWELGKTEH